MKLAAVEIDDIQECIDDCPRAKQTKKNMRTVCSLIYKYAVPRGYAPMSMAPYLPSPVKTPRRVRALMPTRSRR